MGDDHVEEVSAGEFDGRFHRFSKKLGRGATKKVFLAYDTERGVDCAWNQISLHSLTPDEQEGLEKEINVMKSLDHGNILKYHAHWTTANFLCFITDYQTHSLKNYINERKIRLSTVKNWSRQILSGLAHLHQRKILHRDIKCDNLFLNSQNSKVVIGDLGLAKEMTKATGANGEPMSIVGTPQFMAPEQLHLQSHYDEKVDIYALGMCIIEMITRTYPYAECKTILEVITCINEQRDCLALTRIKSENSSLFIQWCCHRTPECRPGALEALQHSWLCRTTAEDNKYCVDLVTPLEPKEKPPTKPNPLPANADVPLKPNQHDVVDTGPVEDLEPRPSLHDEFEAVKPDAPPRPGVNAPVTQPTAHSANLTSGIPTAPSPIVNPNSQVGNHQFSANSQPNASTFTNFAQPVFNQPQMSSFMNPMPMPNFNPMMYMNMNPGMNPVVSPQMVQQFLQMTQNAGPNANLNPQMIQEWLKQMLQQQATANFMTQQWMQQQWTQFVQQQGLTVPPSSMVPNASGTPVHAPTPSNGATIPSIQGSTGSLGTIPSGAIPSVPSTIPSVPSEPHLSAKASTSMTPIEAPPSNNSTTNTEVYHQQFTPNGTGLEGPPPNFNQPSSANTTPQPSYNQTPTQPFPNSYAAPGTYATQKTQPSQFKQAPSSNNQQQYQNPNPAPPTPYQNSSPTPSQSAQFQNPTPQPNPAPQIHQPQQFNSPPSNQSQFPPSGSVSSSNQQYNSSPYIPYQAAPAAQPQYQKQAPFQQPQPAFSQQGTFRSEPQIPRTSFSQFGATTATSLSASAQSSTSHSPSTSPQLRTSVVNPVASASQTTDASGTSKKRDSPRKREFPDSKIVTLKDPVKVVSVEVTDQSTLYYVLRIYNPSLEKGKKFGIPVEESDDVSQTIHKLLKDKQLPLEWQDLVHFAIQQAKDLLDQPQHISTSRSESIQHKRDSTPFGDTSRRSSTHHVPGLDHPSIIPSDDDRPPIQPIPILEPSPARIQVRRSADPIIPLIQPPKAKRQRSRDSADISPPRGVPTLRRHNSAPSIDSHSDSDPSPHLSKPFFHDVNQANQSDAINHSLSPNQALPDAPSSLQKMKSIEKPPSPREDVNQNVTKQEELKADPTRTPQRQTTSTGRGDVHTLDDDRPSPPVSTPSQHIPFAAFPIAQDDLLRRIVYMTSEELLDFCEMHQITHEGMPIPKDLDDPTLHKKVYHHILAERGEKQKPIRRKKTKKKEKENEKPKAKRIQSLNTTTTKEENNSTFNARRGSEPVLTSLTKAKVPESLQATQYDTPELALNHEMGRLCDKSDEDGTLMPNEPIKDTLLEETNKKDQTQSLVESILEFRKFMEMSDSQGNSKDLKRMMLINLEKLKAVDKFKYEELIRRIDFSMVIPQMKPLVSEPQYPNRITRPCTEISPNSEDSDSFFIAMAYSLNRLGYEPEVTAMGVRMQYCRELQAIIDHDEKSAENLSRRHQKVRKRILRMYKDSKEQAMAVLEKFSHPGFWHQHLFDNSKGILSEIWRVRFRLFMDGFDEDQIVEIGKDPELNEIEIFQERIYEDGVPAFVYRIVDMKPVKEGNVFDEKETEPFMTAIINDLLSKQTTNSERTRKAKAVKEKPTLVVNHSKSSMGCGTNESTPRESPTKPEPIEPLNDEPLDPFQSLMQSSIHSINSSSSLRKIESFETICSAKDDSSHESPSKAEPMDPIIPEVPKEKSKPKLTKEQKEQRKLEKARKRAEIEARIAEEQQRLQQSEVKLQTNPLSNAV